MVWQEESIALESIFAQDAEFPSDSCALISIDVHGMRMTLDFRIPGGYPDCAPIIGVRFVEPYCYLPYSNAHTPWLFIAGIQAFHIVGSNVIVWQPTCTLRSVIQA
jgi:hypothetical protein